MHSYFDEILNDTSDDVEDVIVEADGQWHTADNKFGSAAWKAAHPPIKDPTLSLPPTPIKRRSPTPVKPVINGDARPQAGPSNPEIVILDSDDEDEGQVKRELSPSVYRTANGSLGSYPPRSQTVESDVIDLTLDSDDEAPIMTTLHSKKRKSDERDLISPTEKIWKKSRLDGPASSGPNTPTSVSYAGSAGETKGGPYSPPRDPTRTLPPLSPNRYSNAYSSRTYPPPYIPSGTSPIPSRDPRTTNVSANSYPPSSYLSRPNGTASSSSGQWRT
ncbi:hypothetical protein PHLCEN_2v513 [Hermanssonia centrifuga]|uniref:Uncharacterized protein n=1 Tax=Hermanssonia centrifuga TaxID=98765 RepID=A0A2R6S656_9APHY|nr:hypothetical protein PHLCEN_2v513 [Hermanssonia centrifuga]